MKRTVGNFRNQYGFTMIEIISVLVIMAIIGAVAVSRVSSIGQSTLQANADKLKVHLRYAQLRALNSTERVWGIDFSSDSYRLFYSIPSDASNTVHSVPFLGEDRNPDPNKDPNSITLKNTTITFGGNPLSFDTWGKPYQNLRANFDSSPVPQSTDRNITLTDTGGNTKSITITKNTGYIP
jgi:prepilin-type N-terminal cleavage/methylation domain-containing protein